MRLFPMPMWKERRVLSKEERVWHESELLYSGGWVCLLATRLWKPQSSCQQNSLECKN